MPKIFSDTQNPEFRTLTHLYWKYDYPNEIQGFNQLSELINTQSSLSPSTIIYNFFTSIPGPSMGVAIILHAVSKAQKRSINTDIEERIIKPAFQEMLKNIRDSQGNLTDFKNMCDQVMSLAHSSVIKNKLMAALWRYIVVPCVEDAEGQIPRAADVLTDCLCRKVYYLKKPAPEFTYFFDDVLDLIATEETFKEYLLVRRDSLDNRFEQIFLRHIEDGLLNFYSIPDAHGYQYIAQFSLTAKKKLLRMAHELLDWEKPREARVITALFSFAMESLYLNSATEKEVYSLDELKTYFDENDNNHKIFIGVLSRTPPCRDIPPSVLCFLATNLMTIPMTSLEKHSYPLGNLQTKIKEISRLNPQFYEHLNSAHGQSSTAQNTLGEALLPDVQQSRLSSLPKTTRRERSWSIPNINPIPAEQPNAVVTELTSRATEENGGNQSRETRVPQRNLVRYLFSFFNQQRRDESMPLLTHLSSDGSHKPSYV